MCIVARCTGVFEIRVRDYSGAVRLVDLPGFSGLGAARDAADAVNLGLSVSRYDPLWDALPPKVREAVWDLKLDLRRAGTDPRDCVARVWVRAPDSPDAEHGWVEMFDG